MKILWFTNNSVNLDSNTLAGGWMQRLEVAISKDVDIQLFIATRFKNKAVGKTVVNNTTYIPICDKRSLIEKRIDLMRNREPHDLFLSQYLYIVNDVKPDVIHIFGSEMDYGLIFNKTSIPTILHIQGILNPCFYQLDKNKVSFFRQIMSHSLIDYIRGSTFSNGFKTFKRRTRVESRILGNCQNVIGRTEWDKRVMSILAPDARYFHCDEMLRDEYFEASWCAKESNVLNIVSTISGPAYKGHDNIIATCRVLVEAGVKFQWHIVGISSDSVAYRLHYRKSKKLIKDIIEFHGNLPPKLMIQVLVDADVYVHPSHIENSSNALCEAMALGMPVIALDVGGNASMVESGIDGMIVPDNDPFSLAGMIKILVQNKVLSAQLGHHAKLRATARHDPDTIITQLKAIYSELVEPHAI